MKKLLDNKESIVIVGDNGVFKTVIDKEFFLEKFYKMLYENIEEMERLAKKENAGVSIQDLTENAIQLTFEKWVCITIEDRWAFALYKCLISADMNILDEQVWQLVKLMLECKRKDSLEVEK